MKEIKAFIHKDRISEVVAALNASGCRSSDERTGCRSINVAAVQSLTSPAEGEEQHYSMELAETVVREWKLELFCEDEQTDQLVKVIAQAASIGRGIAGWIFVTEVVSSIPILGPSKYGPPN
ncbi:MAG: P-II family nitrogen regulator [Betaproteobacteria bacterium]|nr:P-II family nitrogen regulator [Betaproteobacteria bacterium]